MNSDSDYDYGYRPRPTLEAPIGRYLVSFIRTIR